MKKLWNWFWHTSNRLVFASLLFLAGVIAWGAFNTAMEVTNTMDFCIGCHEMKDNVYEEYRETVHFHNRSGVRAECADCHVPKDWFGKVARKIQATNELYHKVMGTVDTREKFEDERLIMAQRVWTTMRENGSQECRNCHAYDAMHADKQGSRAKKTMAEAAKHDVACIDCHKGIAHKLPKFDGIYASWAEELQAAVAADDLAASTVFAAAADVIYTEQDEKSEKVAEFEPMAELEVLEDTGEWIKVRLNAWDREGGVQLFAKAGPQMQVAKLSFGGMETVKQTEQWIDPVSELTWNKASVEGWVKKGQSLTSDFAMVEDYAEKLWTSDCNLCHTKYDTTRFNARDWVKYMKKMRRFTHLDQAQQTMVLKYMQSRSSDMVAAQ